MLYSLGYKSGLELNTTERSDPFAIIAEGLTTLTVNTGRIFVNGVDQGATANATPGAVVEIEASSSNQFAVPTFVQFRQDGELQGIFTLINRIEETFVYDDRLNDLYAFEVLNESTWVPTDNGRVGIIDTQNPVESPADSGNFVLEPTFVDLVPQELDFENTALYRNKIHVLDYYLNQINVFDFNGNYLGRPPIEYDGPIDSTTLYSELSSSRILTVIAYERSDKVVLYNNEYREVNAFDIVQPVGVITRLNDLYIAQRGSNDITVVNYDDTGVQQGTSTITMPRRPHRLYLIEGRVAVLTQSSIEFIADNNTIEYSIALPQFASSLAYDVLNDIIYVTHRQERNLSKINLSIGGTSPITTRFYGDQGYLDAITYDRFEDVIWVSDVVTRQLLKLDSDLNIVDSIDMLDKHSYEMYFVAGSRKVIFNSLYPDIDERLILGDGDPDAQEYENIEGILPGQTVTSRAYGITGVRDPVTLYLFPDDTDVITRVRTPQGSFSSGTVVNPEDEFNFEVGLPGGRSRRIEFVLGQSVYSFIASPDNSRIIPEEEIYAPLEYVEPDIDVISQTNTVTGLDSPNVTITTDGNSILYVNGQEAGTEATLVNGDSWYLSARSGANFCDRVYTTVDYSGVFQSTWVIVTRSDEGQTVNQPNAQDFVDIVNADLGTLYTSEPTTIVIPDGGSAYAEINSDYGAELLVNGVNQGQSATINDGDSVRIRLTTTFIYDTDHQITLSFCKRSFTWIVKTLPAVAVIPLNFGFIDGVTLGDRVESERIVLDTVPDYQEVRVTIPRNTKAIVNGQPYNFPASQLNYRDVVRVPTVITIRGQDEIYLEGYANGVYGSVTQHKILAGISVGYWSIRSISTGSSLPSRELLAILSRSVLDTRDSELAVVGADAANESLALTTSAQNDGTYFAEASSLSDNGNATDVRTGVQYFLPMPDSEWRKHTGIVVEINGDRTPVKGVPHAPKPFNSDAVYNKRGEGLAAYHTDAIYVKRTNGQHLKDTVAEFIKDPTGQRIEFKGNFIKQTSGMHLSDAPFEFELRRQNSHIVADLEYEKQKGLNVVDPQGLEYQKYQNTQSVNLEILYNKPPAYRINEVTITYGKPEAPEVNEVIIEYNKPDAPGVVEMDIEYGKPDAPGVVDMELEYNKTSAPDVIAFNKLFDKQLSATIALSPIWIGVDVDFDELGGPKVIEESVKATVGDLPLKVINTQYNLTTEANNSGMHIVLNMPNAVEGGPYAHQAIGQQIQIFQPIDTFSVQVLDWKEATITEDDCLLTGYEVCTDVGYFATEQEAIDDATQVWGVPLTVVRTNEVRPGCWIWSQRLPCTNSCYGCPPTGYIHGG